MIFFTGLPKLMFALFDLHSLDSLHALYILLNIDLSNFLEYICCLKNIKPAYLSHQNISKLYEVLLFFQDIDISNFVYFKHLKLLCNKTQVIPILNKYNKDLSYLQNLTTTYFQNEDSIIIGDILGYQCPGLQNRSKSNSTGISYDITFTSHFKELFNVRNNHLQIIGYNCLKSDIYSKLPDIYLYEESLNTYFQTLDIGTINLHFI